MFNVEVTFASLTDDPKAVAERLVRAMYGKTLTEFAWEMERAIVCKSAPLPTRINQEEPQ